MTTVPRDLKDAIYFTFTQQGKNHLTTTDREEKRAARTPDQRESRNNKNIFKKEK